MVLKKILQRWLLASLLCVSLPALAQNNFSDTITVGMAGNAPFIVDTSLRTGISIEIWDALAGELVLPYQTVFYEDVPHLLAALEQGRIQAAVGPISITSERAEKVMFSQPYFQSSLSIMSGAFHPGLWDRIAPFFSEKFFFALLIFILILAIVGAILWVTERKVNPEQFPARPASGIANGMWCAIVTMTTTGYGDIAPRTFWGRFTASAWMVISLIFATSLVAGFASVLTLSGMNKSTVTTAEELPGKMVAVIPGSPAENFVREHGGKIKEIENVAEGYDLLKNKKVNAVVFDRPQLQYYLNEHPDEDIVISVGEYQRQGYGFAFPLNEKRMHDINIALLELGESGIANQIFRKWLGFDVGK